MYVSTFFTENHFLIGVIPCEAIYPRISHFDINAEDISAGRLIWKRGSVDRFTGKGRSRNLLYLMLSGSRNYYINGKFEFSLHDGDLIFIPSGACYSSKVEECDTAEGIYVDFNLTLGGKPFYLDESFRRFTADRVQKERFMRLAESSGVRLLAKADASVYPFRHFGEGGESAVRRRGSSAG